MSESAFNRKKSTEAGFTLVEIAIVLVIIGLLLGGILKGQEMITQAKIKNVINDFNGITVAVTSYQDRYRALPGVFFFNDTATTEIYTLSLHDALPISGAYNANDTSGTGGAPAAAAESNLFWQHRSVAHTAAVQTTCNLRWRPPPDTTGGLIGVESGVVGTSGLGFTSTVICFSNLPEKVASAVDGQMDDSKPASGQVRAQLQSTANPATLSASNVTAYVETGVNQYLLCKNF